MKKMSLACASVMAMSALAMLASVPALAQDNDEARERVEQRRARPDARPDSPRAVPPANRADPAPAPQPQATVPGGAAQSAPAPRDPRSAPRAAPVPRSPGAASNSRPVDPRTQRWGTGARPPSPPRYSPPPQNTYRALPPGYHRYGYRGGNYYFFNGYWYSPYSYGYRLIAPPFGLTIYDLPPYYSSYWYGGRHYYYANDVYYLWDPVERGYVVSRSPDGAVEEEADDDIFVYPTRGQNEEQQATDRYECHRWAADQSGFDPTLSGGGVEAGEKASDLRADYRRAETACLEGRGYSVR